MQETGGVRDGHSVGEDEEEEKKGNLIPLLLPQTRTSKMASDDSRLPQLLLWFANETNEK